MNYLKSALFLFAIIAIDALANGQCIKPAPIQLVPKTCVSEQSSCSESQGSYKGSCEGSSQQTYPSENCYQPATTTQKPKVYINKQPPIVVNRPGKSYTIPAGQPICIKPAPVVIQRPGQNQNIPISVTVTGKPIIINKKIVKVERPVVKKYYVESHTEQQPSQDCQEQNKPLPPVDQCASVLSASSQSSYSPSSYSQSSNEKPLYEIPSVPSTKPCSEGSTYQAQTQVVSQQSEQQSPLATMINAASSMLGSCQSGKDSTLKNIINAVSSAFSSAGGVDGAPSAGLGNSLISSLVGSKTAGLGGASLVGLVGTVPGVGSTSSQQPCQQQSQSWEKQANDQYPSWSQQIAQYDSSATPQPELSAWGKTYPKYWKAGDVPPYPL